MSGVRLSINTTDLNNFLRDINKFSDEKIKAVDKEVARATYSIHKNAVRRAPIRKKAGRKKGSFGLLKGTIEAQVNQGKVSGRVIARAHYAPYREFGTGNLTKIPQGYTEYAAQFKGAGVRQVNSRATPFLISSMEEEAKRFESNLKNIFR